MKLWKNSLLLIGIFTLALSSISVCAESDPTGDVYHQIVTENNLTWELYSGEKPNIDITDISYSISGSEATVTMTVAGTIQDAETIGYYVHLAKDDTSFYQIYYFNGVGIFSGSGDYSGTWQLLESPPISSDGKSLTYTFEIDTSDPSAEYTPWGWSVELANVENQGGEAWLDYAPGTYAPWYTSGDGDVDGGENGDGDTSTDGDDGTSGGTPGFEIFALLAAVAIVFIVLKKRT